MHDISAGHGSWGAAVRGDAAGELRGEPPAGGSGDELQPACSPHLTHRKRAHMDVRVDVRVRAYALAIIESSKVRSCERQPRPGRAFECA